MMKLLKMLQAMLSVLVILPVMATAALASSGGAPLPQQNWSFHGPFGQFDTAAMKRGAQVVAEVCLACHSVKYIKFDQLKQIGLTEVEVNAIAAAAGKNRKDAMLSSTDADAAKESFGVVPPDLSLMTKARKGYEDYLYGILTGYLKDEDKAAIDRALEDGTVSEAEIKELSVILSMDPHQPDKIRDAVQRIKNGDNFNKFFPGNFFAMPAPLAADGQVTYQDGTHSSVAQMSHDAVTFLAWAAEPTMMERKSAGIKVILYLVVLTVMFYAVKRRIWARIHH
ncbi:MAG: hypothetical protein HQL58_02925 [Magnetococcales bacterium]|nr:hypothetical protein [Magnetococcales bacterium]